MIGFELDGRANQEQLKFKGKKIGYYIGSFDPFHKGHEAIVDAVLKRDLADFVLVCPVYGADAFKNRSDVKVRVEMLEALYIDHPRVVYTRMTPKQLQGFWLKNNFDQSAQVIGILGADTAIATQKCSKRSQVFMSGMLIPKKYEKHTAGNLLALRASSFILAKRDECCDGLTGIFLDLPVDAYIDHNFSFCSSTRIRNAISKRQDVSAMCSKEVIEVIRNYDLYND